MLNVFTDYIDIPRQGCAYVDYKNKYTLFIHMFIVDAAGWLERDESLRREAHLWQLWYRSHYASVIQPDTTATYMCRVRNQVPKPALNIEMYSAELSNVSILCMQIYHQMYLLTGWHLNYNHKKYSISTCRLEIVPSVTNMLTTMLTNINS